MYGKKLRKQLKKSIGVELPEDILKVLAENEQNGLSKLVQFLDRIEKAYDEYEDRLKISERNIDISSSELSAANAQLRNLTQTIAAMVDSLGEGYLVFDSKGLCENVYSKICEQIFGISPSGVVLPELLQLEGEDKESYDLWLNLAFAGRLSEEDLNSLGPQRYTNRDGKHFKLRFRPMCVDDNIQSIVMIATDITKEIEANVRASKKVEEATELLNVAKDKEGFRVFMETLTEIVAGFRKLNPEGENLKGIRFDLHTLKGGASVFSLYEIEELIHQEELRIKRNPSEHPYSKVEFCSFIEKMDSMISATQTKFQPLLGSGKGLQPYSGELPEDFKFKVAQLRQEGMRDDHLDAIINQVIGSDLQLIFERFARLVEVTAARLGKDVAPLKIEGSPVKIPYRPYRAFFASLVHIFRNALDHGIEEPEKRKSAGKSGQGVIKVLYDYNREKGAFKIDIIDDGRGIDIALAQESLKEKFPDVDICKWSDEQILNAFVFAGVSSKSKITEVSGMGIGCGAVAQEVERLGGKWQVSSTPGQGTRFSFLIPYVSWPMMLTEKKWAA